jgi:hypothetical protein
MEDMDMLSIYADLSRRYRRPGEEGSKLPKAQRLAEYMLVASEWKAFADVLIRRMGEGR